MRVGINVLPQSPRVFDGALSQFLQMGEMLPGIDQETNYVLLAGGADVEYYRQRTRVDEVIDAGTSDRGILLRIASEHFLLGRACKRNGVDVLFYQSAGAVPLLLPKDVKVVLAVWGAQDPASISLPWPKRLYRKLFNQRGLKRVSHLILNSNYTRELFEKRYSTKLPATVIHHGIDERLFHASVDPEADRAVVRNIGLHAPYVLFVGQARHYKLLHVLVQAFARAVSDKGLPHQLAVVASFDKQHNRQGDTYRGQLLEMLEARGLSDRAVFLQDIPVSQLRALYAGSDLYVQSSASETFGRTVIEAMACGAPVLAARGGATSEVLGQAGRYYEPNDVSGCADAIAEILGDPQLRATLIALGFDRVKRFSRTAELRQMANVFRVVAGQSPIKP